MGKTILQWCGLTGGLFLSACATGIHSPAVGLLYTDTQYPQSVTAKDAGNRVGEACSYAVLGLVATGDSSIEAARRNGGLTTISSVDESTYSILGFVYGKQCTIVRGH